MKSFLLLSLLVSAALSAHIDLSSYPLSVELRPNTYTLHWGFDVSAQTIRFAVNVSTTGWVGLGLSPTGGMPNSDIVIGWVNDQGEAFLHDRYAEGESLPSVDQSQDWILDGGMEQDGFTVLAFRRDWVTCDDRDREIKVETARVIYSWNNADPAGDDPNSVAYHGNNNRGTLSINLLGIEQELPPEPTNPLHLRTVVNNITLPTADTTYWCSTYELPAEVQAQKHYITKISPVVTEGNEAFVHHIVVYECDSLEAVHVGESAVCMGQVSETVNECRGGTVLMAWAVGGTDFYYPENVAYPIGGGGPRFIVMETHYDNPNRRAGIMDSSGLVYTYTATPPLHEAGILNVGLATTPLHIIPPGTQLFGTFGDCAPECTAGYFPEDGITVFSNFLHTHLAGSGVTLRHYRQTSEGGLCNALEELEPIEQNPSYDFDYQQYTTLPRPITVLPGDTLRVDCNYRTKDRDEVTFGGPSTQDEMCISFLAYYPRVNLTACFSNPNSLSPSYASNFLTNHVPMELQTEIRLASSSFSGIRRAWSKVNWTSEGIASFESDSVNGPLIDFCLPSDATVADLISLSIPFFPRNGFTQPDCDYQPADQCTGFQPQDCCSRLESSGGTPTIAASVRLLVFVSLVLVLLALF